MKKSAWSVLIVVIVLMVASNFAQAGAVRTGFTLTPLSANDDGSTGAINIGFPVNFFGQTYTQLYVNNNGNVTFDAPQGTYTPYDLLGTQRKIIAPFFADVDTRGFASDLVKYGYTHGTVNGHSAFIVNWVNVGYYNSRSDKLNSFQLVLIDRSDISPGLCTIEFNYDKIQWETGDASGGVNGFGGYSARAGFSNGSISLELPGSGVNGGFLDSNTTGLIHHKTSEASVLGRYNFLTMFLSSDGQWAYPSWMTPVSICLDGCPVDLASGEEEYLAEPAITVSSPSGIKASFVCNYYTTRAKAGTMSAGLTEGWVHNYEDYIKNAQTGAWGALYLFEAAGGQVPLIPQLDGNGNPTGAFSVQLGAPFTATGTPSTIPGEWQSIVITKSDGTKKTFTYVTTGLLVLSSITDNIGRSLSLQWDANRRLQSIVDVDSLTTIFTFTYGTNGVLASVLDNAGRKVNFTSSVPGNGIMVPCLTSVSQVCANTENNPSVLSSYTYTAYQGHPLIASFSDPNPTGQGQRFVQFTYNLDTGKVSTQVTPNGNVHHYVYGDGQTQVNITDSQGHQLTTRTEHFDLLGRKVSVTDAAGHSSSLEYNDLNNPYRYTKLTDRDGKTVTFTYDQYGNTITSTDVRGVTTTNIYDYSQWVFGRLIRVKQGTKPPVSMTYLEPSGLLTSKTTPKPGSTTGETVATTYTYDFEKNPEHKYGRIVAITHPGNNTGVTISDTYTYNYTSDSKYDANGDPGSFTTSSNGFPLTITDKYGRTTHMRYDARGNVIVRIDPDGLRTDTVYNLANQPTSVQLPPSTAGSGRRTVTIDYQYPGGLTWRTTNDDTESNQIRQVVTTYDVDGNILSIVGGSNSVSYQYDALGRRTHVIDGSNHATIYSYDNIDRITRITYPDGSTVQNISFNNEGQILESIDGNGIHSTFSYSNGLLASIDYLNTAGVDIQYQHDAYGRLEVATDSTGNKSYTYDANDLPLTETVRYTGQPDQTISYQYYPDGNKRLLQTPFGSFSYKFNDYGQMTALTTPSGRVSRWTYRQDHRLNKQQLGNRSWTNYSYNTLGQLSELSNYSSKGRIFSRYSVMTRDDLDNITEVNTSVPGLPSEDGHSSYQYDDGGLHLIQEDWSASLGGMSYTQDITFDLNGNLTQFSHDIPGYVGLTRAYNTANQWIGYYDAEGNLTATDFFTYDGNGNATTFRGNHLSFNNRNELTLYATSGNQPVLSAGYSADGLRAWKDVNGQRTYFIYDGNQLLYELNSNGVVTSYYVWGTEGLLGRMTPTSGKETWYQYDVTGNVTHRLDGTGRVMSNDKYDVWGNILSGGDLTDPVGYHGKQGYYTDHETGLVLCLHRYYDPSSGRWISRDPIGYQSGLNLYEYCDNNPANEVDPSGLAGVGVLLAGGADVGLVEGAGAGGSAGWGGFWGDGANFGGFASLGCFLGGPGAKNGWAYPRTEKKGAIGAYAGIGIGPYVTNANNKNELKGPFQVLNINLALGYGGSIQVGWDSTSGTFIVSGGVGYGYGVDVSWYNTNTW